MYKRQAQDFGSRDRALAIGVQAIVKAALATIFIHPTSPDSRIVTGSPNNDLQINFRRTRGVTPVYEEASVQVIVDNRPFQEICDELTTHVTTKCEDGFYPYTFKFEGGGRGNEYRQLGDSIITLTAATKLQIQNTTQEDAGLTSSTAHSITCLLYTSPSPRD